MKLVERQRRSIERWGFRGGNQQNKEQEMLAQLKHYGILPLQFRVTSISNLLQELNEWECSLESNDAEENGGSDDEDEIAQDVLNDVDAPDSAAAAANMGKGGDDSDDDDDAIEEVKSGAAKADALRQMQAEREQKKKQAAGKKKKNRSKRKAEEEPKEAVPPSDDEEGPEDRGSDSDDDSDDLDEEFLAMVDSERQTELRLQKLRKKAEKRRKLQAEKKIGRHTTFVSDDGNGALIGENAIGQSIEADHGIDVVVLPTVKRSGGGASDDDSDESGSEDEGYGRVDVSALLGTKPSKAAMLFSRGQVECGEVSRKGNKKVRRSKKGGSKGSRGGKDQGWTRSRKATNLSVARGRIGGPAANFAVKKRKESGMMT